MRMMVLRVINNFGLDFKQFIYKDILLYKLKHIIREDGYSAAEKRDAIMAIKNLSYEASKADKTELEQKISGEYLLELLRDNAELRDQTIIIIKQMFN